jgi:quinol monooxygenase YgiN
LAIYQLADYRVKASAVDSVKRAIKELVSYIEANEPGTHVYLAWQAKEDPTRFVHIFIFENDNAHKRHGQSEAVRRFEAVYKPELVSDGVTFTDYEQMAGKR